MHRRITLICIALLVIPFLSLNHPFVNSAQSIDSCPDALPHRLVDADHGIVTGDGLRMRDNPTLQATLITQLDEGQAFVVIDGPSCADGYTWWQIRFDDVTGWVVQGSAEEYWVIGVDAPEPEETVSIDESCSSSLNPQFELGDRIHAVDNKRVNLRDESSLEGLALGQVTASDVAVVVGASPICNEEQVWWLVDLDGTLGWVLESAGDEPLVQIHRFHDITPASLSLPRPIRYKFSRDTQRLAVAQQRQDEVYVYDTFNSQEPILVIPDEPLLVRWDFALSADGALLAVQYTRQIVFWDIEQGEVVATQEIDDYFRHLQMILYDNRVLANGLEISLNLLDYPNFTSTWEIQSIDDTVKIFDWHFETNQVVAIPTIQSDEIYLANIDTDEVMLLEPNIPTQHATCVRFQPSGMSILLAQSEGQMAQAFLDDDPTEARVIDLGISRNPAGGACAVSNDGRYFAVGYWNSIYIWDLETNDTLLLDGDTNGNWQELAFTEDGTQLLSAATNGDLFTWDMQQLLGN